MDYFNTTYITSCVIHEENGEFKPIIMHFFQLIITCLIFLTISRQRIIIDERHPSYNTAKYLSSLPQPISGISARTLYLKQIKPGIIGKLNNVIYNILSRIFVTWRWTFENNVVCATVPSAGILSWVNIVLICLQFYSALIPCLNNGFFWDERCFTGWFECFGPSSTIILFVVLPDDSKIYNNEFWPKIEDGYIGYYGRLFNIMLNLFQSLLIIIIYIVCILPYIIPILGICLIFYCLTLPLMICSPKNELNKLINEEEPLIFDEMRVETIMTKRWCLQICEFSILYIMSILLIIAIIWAIFASGKLYSGEMNYFDSALCVWEERSFSAYIGYNFGSFRAWISSL